MVCTQFIRVYDLSTNAAAPIHTFYLPATAEDASEGDAGSCIRDVELVPPMPPVSTDSPSSSTLSSEAAVEGWGAGTGAPALLATAIVLTGAGRLYSKGILTPKSSEIDGGSGVGYAHDGEIRHRLAIPPALEEEAGCGEGGSKYSGPRAGDGGGGGGENDGSGGIGASRGGGGDSNRRKDSIGSRGRSESIGGASANSGASISGREDEDVESPISAPESPSYLYLNSFAGCDFEDAANDSPDESLTFAEPGLRRRGWAATAASTAVSASPAATMSRTDALLAMSPAHSARQVKAAAKASAEAAETAAASFGALHFSTRMGLLVVARGGKSTLMLRLRGTGATTEVRGGFVLLPSCVNGAFVGAGSGDVGITPTAQGAPTGSECLEGATSAAAVAAAKTATSTLEANSCLPPYTRFLDYWDGADQLGGGQDDSGGMATAAASLVCVASGGGRVKTDRVLALKIGSGSGEGHTVSFCFCYCWYYLCRSCSIFSVGVAKAPSHRYRASRF